MKRLLGEKILGVVDYYRFPALRNGWGGPFNGQAFRQQIFLELIDRIQFSAIVETGTFHGTTTKYLRESSRLPVYTVELHPRYYAYAKTRFLLDRRIKVCYSDSRTFLARFVTDPAFTSKRVFFYLDAHWNEILPLADEIQIIFESNLDAVVMVDDFRVPDDTGYGYDDYGEGKELSLEYIGPLISKLKLVPFFPSEKAESETGAQRGCVVLARTPNLVERLGKMKTLVYSGTDHVYAHKGQNDEPNTGKMNPRISVIISTYNSETFIRGRLKNLVEQTAFADSEVIVVNSRSQQNEEQIVREFQDRYPNIIYLATPQRETIYKAWNRGIAIARGKYIANANTDDRSREDALEIFADILDAHPNVAMVYADQYVTSIPNSSFEASIHKKRNYRFPFSRMRLFAGYYLGSQQMWRASLHFKDGIWFNEKYEVTGDYEFACRVAELYELMLIPDVLGVYYLSKTKSNKQFQNSDQFLSEDTEVREKYLPRYLSTLSNEELGRLYRKARFWIAIPRRVYTLLHRGLDVAYPRKQIPNRIFWCWLGSHMEERLGNIEEAKSLCRKCLKIPSATVIHRRYRDLTEKYR